MQKTLEHFQKKDLFARHCGIELIALEPGRAQGRMVIQPWHYNGAGTVHGGAIFTLADFVFAAASNSRGKLAMGINTSTSFVKAARGKLLFAEAVEMACQRRLATYQVRVTDEQDELIALFQGTVYRKDMPLMTNGTADEQ